MSIHKLTVGSGYAYLTRQVAELDSTKKGHTGLASYYTKRCRNDAAFAALSGTSPLQASSGKTVRHRLNRGGDRALNSTIHTIAITRIRCCPTTKNYVARRTAEDKSSQETQRCLTRYVAPEPYRTLNISATLTAQTMASSIILPLLATLLLVLALLRALHRLQPASASPTRGSD
jgi:hypothetical protein